MKKLIPIILLLNFSIKAQDVKIGTQTWTSKNLEVSTYRNGDTIPQVQNADTWVNLKTGAWCYYENDSANGKKYGKLYNWYAVNDPRGLAPKGYHIPTDAEWIKLENFLGENEAGAKMKSTSGWVLSGNGTNSSGFSGLPGGHRVDGGSFEFDGQFGYWWSSTEVSLGDAWYRDLFYYKPHVTRNLIENYCGNSVRCIKN